MKKIISLYQRNYNGDRLVKDELIPGAEWVIAGEGVATQKFDGTCCMVRDGQLYKRYDAKVGKQPPEGFEPAQPDPDPVTGHWPGWILIGNSPEDKYHNEAWVNELRFDKLLDGTYELCGPKVNGNPEGHSVHVLLRHGSKVLADCPRDFEGVKAYLSMRDIEGVVWHHPDGRMVKIKGRDFGIKRGAA
jgi:hypothetical protein